MIHRHIVIVYTLCYKLIVDQGSIDNIFIKKDVRTEYN